MLQEQARVRVGLMLKFCLNCIPAVVHKSERKNVYANANLRTNGTFLFLGWGDWTHLKYLPILSV